MTPLATREFPQRLLARSILLGASTLFAGMLSPIRQRWADSNSGDAAMIAMLVDNQREIAVLCDAMMAMIGD